MSAWKDIVQYTTAVASMASGIALTFFQFFNTGDISNGVLGYVGQTLLYAASIFGVTMYWNGKYNQQVNLWSNKFNELRKLVEDDKRAKLASNSSQKPV